MAGHLARSGEASIQGEQDRLLPLLPTLHTRGWPWHSLAESRLTAHLHSEENSNTRPCMVYLLFSSLSYCSPPLSPTFPQLSTALCAPAKLAYLQICWAPFPPQCLHICSPLPLKCPSLACPSGLDGMPLSPPSLLWAPSLSLNIFLPSVLSSKPAYFLHNTNYKV